MSELFDTTVRDVRRLLDAAYMTGVPRTRLAYLVTPTEHDILRMEIVNTGRLCGPTTYTPTSIRILGVPVVPHE